MFLNNHKLHKNLSLTNKKLKMYFIDGKPLSLKIVIVQTS